MNPTAMPFNCEIAEVGFEARSLMNAASCEEAPAALAATPNAQREVTKAVARMLVSMLCR